MEVSESLCEMEDEMVKLKSTAEQACGDYGCRILEKEKNKAARKERLKSGFTICKPQGSFLWPNMALSPQLAVQTPPFVSSSTASAPHFSTSPEKQLVTVSSSPTKTTTATITTTKTTLINLNEIPGSRGSSILSHSTTSAVTYQRRHHSTAPREKKGGCSTSSPIKPVGAESWLALPN